jgi:hypothetical protein
MNKCTNYLQNQAIPIRKWSKLFLKWFFPVFLLRKDNKMHFKLQRLLKGLFYKYNLILFAVKSIFKNPHFSPKFATLINLYKCQ